MTEPWSSEPPTIPPSAPSYPGAWRPAPPVVGEPAAAGWGVPGGPTGPAGGEGRGRDPQQTALLIAGIAAVVVLLLGSLWIITGRRSSTAATAPSTTTTTRPSTTTNPPGGSSTTTTSPSSASSTLPPATQPELDATVAELSTFVEKQRGLTYKSPVKAKLASDDEFNQELLKDFDKDTAEFSKETTIFEALGMMPAGTDVAAALKKLLSGGVLGFYDPETDELYVRGTALTPYVKETLVHELTHALDDQHFDLDRNAYDERKDEIGFGFSALAEGNARRVEQAWRTQLSPADAAARDREELEFGKGMDLRGVPEIFLVLLQAPYELGETFVDQLVRDKGQAGLDAAFGTPPDTSEQVMHTKKYETGEKRVEVTPPPADGPIEADGVFGEFLLGMLLASASTDADVAAAGWGGDWYVTWKDAQRGTCARLAVQTDTVRDLDELLAALQEWQQKANPEAEISTLGPQSVEVESCTPSSAGGGQSPL